MEAAAEPTGAVICVYSLKSNTHTQMDPTQKLHPAWQNLSRSNQRTLCCAATSSYLRCSRKMHWDVDFDAEMNGLVNESLTVTQTSPALLNLFFFFLKEKKPWNQHVMLESALIIWDKLKNL